MSFSEPEDQASNAPSEGSTERPESIALGDVLVESNRLLQEQLPACKQALLNTCKELGDVAASCEESYLSVCFDNLF